VYLLILFCYPISIVVVHKCCPKYYQQHFDDDKHLVRSFSKICFVFQYYRIHENFHHKFAHNVYTIRRENINRYLILLNIILHPDLFNISSTTATVTVFETCHACAVRVFAFDVMQVKLKIQQNNAWIYSKNCFKIIVISKGYFLRSSAWYRKKWKLIRKKNQTFQKLFLRLYRNTI
jgi:hypothetical protein